MTAKMQLCLVLTVVRISLLAKSKRRDMVLAHDVWDGVRTLRTSVQPVKA